MTSEMLLFTDKVYAPGCNSVLFQYACAGRVKVAFVIVAALAPAAVKPRRVNKRQSECESFM